MLPCTESGDAEVATRPNYEGLLGLLRSQIEPLETTVVRDRLVYFTFLSDKVPRKGVVVIHVAL